LLPDFFFERVLLAEFATLGQNNEPMIENYSFQVSVSRSGGDGAAKPLAHRPASSSMGQWERWLQTDIDMPRRALREALTPLGDLKPQQHDGVDAAAASTGGGGGGDSPASSSSGASLCSPSMAAPGPYVRTTEKSRGCWRGGTTREGLI
jgi:hypothetical protein